MFWLSYPAHWGFYWNADLALTVLINTKSALLNDAIIITKQSLFRVKIILCERNNIYEHHGIANHRVELINLALVEASYSNLK